MMMHDFCRIYDFLRVLFPRINLSAATKCDCNSVSIPHVISTFLCIASPGLNFPKTRIEVNLNRRHISTMSRPYPQHFEACHRPPYFQFTLPVLHSLRPRRSPRFLTSFAARILLTLPSVLAFLCRALVWPCALQYFVAGCWFSE